MFPLLIMGVLLVATEARSLRDVLCETPPVPGNYTFDATDGLWYEIGKYQTLGGAAFQANCVCTTMTLDHYDRQTGDSKVTYECRDKVPEGDLIAFPADLVDMEEPGKWTQKTFPLAPAVSWQVVILGDGYGATYDCGTAILGTEYCVHFISRQPTLDAETLEAMKRFTTDLDLNPLELQFNEINHDGCW